MLRHVLALMAGMLLAQPGAVAATRQTIESFTLANGLEVIVLPNHRVPAVNHMVWYRIGAADDPPGKSGLAHYHEHLMFLGTDQFKSGEYNRLIDKHGGDHNAFTTYDATSYFVTIAKEELPLAMKLEADRMRGISPGEADALKERNVILEERRQRTDNSPRALLLEQMNAALFRHHPYRIPVIGWAHEMAGLTRSDALQFHADYYHPANAILVLSGDITAAEARPLVERYYGDLPKKPLKPRIWNQEPPQLAARTMTLRHESVKQPAFYRAYSAASLKHGKSEQALPLFVLSQILGEGENSILYQSLVVKQKLATDVSSDHDLFALGPAVFSIHIVPEQGVSMATLEAALDAELGRLVAQPVDDALLKRRQKNMAADAVYAREGLSNLSNIMGLLVSAGLPAELFNQWPDKIHAVTPAQIRDAVAATLKPEQSVTGYLLPAEAQP